MACFFAEESMNRWKLVFTIFAVTFSTMLVEVLLTRVFSVIYFGQFAFLIISLALFGFGLSGVYLALRKATNQVNQATRLARFLLCFTISLPLAYKATLVFSIDFLRLFNPFGNFLYLVLNFLVLLLPFFFGGVVLASIFSNFSENIGRLYFIDLAGASLPGHYPAYYPVGTEPHFGSSFLDPGAGLVFYGRRSPNPAYPRFRRLDRFFCRHVSL
jgi:hypothetical protein